MDETWIERTEEMIRRRYRRPGKETQVLSGACGLEWGAPLRAAWEWLRRRCKAGGIRQLRLCETLPLGEKRFLAVVEFERQRFLLGGTANTLVLLTPPPRIAPNLRPAEGGMEPERQPEGTCR